MDEAACRARYRAAVADVRSLADGLDLEERAHALAAALAPWQLLDPRREQSLGDIAWAVDDLDAFLGARPGDVERVAAGRDAGRPARATPRRPRRPRSSRSPSRRGLPAVAEPPRPLGRAAVSSSASGRHGRPPSHATTTVRVPGAGVVAQRASVRAGSRTVSLCSTRATARGAGTISLRCRLGRAAQRRALRAGGAPRSRHDPVLARAGAPRSVTRTVVLRRP